MRLCAHVCALSGSIRRANKNTGTPSFLTQRSADFNTAWVVTIRVFPRFKTVYIEIGHFNSGTRFSRNGLPLEVNHNTSAVQDLHAAQGRPVLFVVQNSTKGFIMKSSSSKSYKSPHGGGIRGADNDLRSPVFEGRFGRMFRELPPAVHTDQALIKLGEAMTAAPELDAKGRPAAALETTDHLQDDEENAGISAGYTYFGQFIDHDITFDPASLQEQQNDPEAMINFRTPRLDLDSLYGRGPADQPYMYREDGNPSGARINRTE